MAAPQAGGGGQPDNSAALLWGIAALFAVLGGLWFIFKPQIIWGYLLFKIAELDVVTFFTGFFHFHTDYFKELHSILSIAKTNPTHVTFDVLIRMGNEVGYWLRVPLAIVLCILAIIIYASNTASVYRRTYNMQEFVKLEKDNWPQISPVANLDLIKTDIDKGPWAMAMTPLQFCKRYHLLEEVRTERRQGESRKGWDKISVVLKRGEANKIFALQLGSLWTGIEHLPAHIKALFAVFAARINADTKAAEAILLQLNISVAKPALDLTGVDELIKKHAGTKPVQQIIQGHAYVATVMASMLSGAREDGVQASADFLWLKPLDRKLWYTLNTVGRQTPFIEVAGIFAHWVAEKEAGRRLLVPVVEEATHAVELALKEVVYKRDEA